MVLGACRSRSFATRCLQLTGVIFTILLLFPEARQCPTDRVRVSQVVLSLPTVLCTSLPSFQTLSPLHHLGAWVKLTLYMISTHPLQSPVQHRPSNLEAMGFSPRQGQKVRSKMQVTGKMLHRLQVPTLHLPTYGPVETMSST